MRRYEESDHIAERVFCTVDEAAAKSGDMCAVFGMGDVFGTGCTERRDADGVFRSAADAVFLITAAYEGKELCPFAVIQCAAAFEAAQLMSRYAYGVAVFYGQNGGFCVSLAKRLHSVAVEQRSRTDGVKSFTDGFYVRKTACLVVCVHERNETGALCLFGKCVKVGFAARHGDIHDLKALGC